MRPIFVEHNLPRDGRDGDARKIRSVTMNLAESPLGWLMARGFVSDRQFAAGELLRRDYETACLGQRTTMNWDAPPLNKRARSAKHPGQSTVFQMSAKQRFDAAIAHAGPGLADILWRVVCGCEPMPIAEKSLGWPARAGRIVLMIALDRIADHYRIA